MKAVEQGPSSNWLALQKKLPVSGKKNDGVSAASARKRRKIGHTSNADGETVEEIRYAAAGTSFARGRTQEQLLELPDSVVNGESLSALRKMISGELEYSSAHQQPGKYLALDCEMVGVGIEGKESSLARVSLVNYHGAVQLDVFVRQREHVVDYRTEFSGVRASDMVNAKLFPEVQKQVAELLKDRILIGHAVHNDLKALLLPHPRSLTRDTQVYAAKYKVTRSRRIALRHLVQQELGVIIQGGEHSSVTDARATMAVFRLHRKEWEKGQRPDALPSTTTRSTAKRKRAPTEGEDSGSTASPTPSKRKVDSPGGGRKGVSSGLSTIVKKRDKGREVMTKTRNTNIKRDVGSNTKGKWWKELGVTSSKGSISLKVGR
ncbi:ribonuclease H-like domain-containing protein [Sparassis latifolia]|uniref:RNA exonuclease 4 n=1 Tax=Sparassis crispa TaxID=139825 RepID=A0A401GGH9_9APHY|nr:RNA exonuclease 4 [Sparassis crispa]GBE81278.1 RNA exonuclease 4 [Sparassis crispa]